MNEQMDEMSIEDVFQHYGYNDNSKHTNGVATGTSVTSVAAWQTEETQERLKLIPAIIRRFGDFDKIKFRVVFDHDPDYPKSLFQMFCELTPKAKKQAAEHPIDLESLPTYQSGPEGTIRIR